MPSSSRTQTVRAGMGYARFPGGMTPTHSPFVNGSLVRTFAPLREMFWVKADESDLRRSPLKTRLTGMDLGLRLQRRVLRIVLFGMGRSSLGGGLSECPANKFRHSDSITYRYMSKLTPILSGADCQNLFDRSGHRWRVDLPGLISFFSSARIMSARQKRHQP